VESRGTRAAFEDCAAIANCAHAHHLHVYSGKGNYGFTRRLEYRADSFAAVKELEKVMRDQSEQAVRQLKMLVEKLLSDEAKPLT
jgi:translation initiation factor 2B subunit (eIF-2B alpha/beta/delta family)